VGFHTFSTLDCLRLLSGTRTQTVCSADFVFRIYAFTTYPPGCWRHYVFHFLTCYKSLSVTLKIIQHTLMSLCHLSVHLFVHTFVLIRGIFRPTCHQLLRLVSFLSFYRPKKQIKMPARQFFGGWLTYCMRHIQRHNATIWGPRHFLRLGHLPSDLK